MPSDRARMLGMWLMALGVLCQVSSGACAADRYFVAVFGSQTFPKIPRFTHTWLAIVHWTDGATPDRAHGDMKVVSWMPDNLNVRTFAFRPETGVNLCMEWSLQDAVRKGQHVAMWGPYELHPSIGPEFYARVCKQVESLSAGEVGYRCLVTETGSTKKPISNCIHAVTNLVPEGNRAYFSKLTRFGEEASEFAVHLFVANRWINPKQTEDWVIPIFGIDSAPVAVRQYRWHPKWGPEFTSRSRAGTGWQVDAAHTALSSTEKVRCCSCVTFAPQCGALQVNLK